MLLSVKCTIRVSIHPWSVCETEGDLVTARFVFKYEDMDKQWNKGESKTIPKHPHLTHSPTSVHSTHGDDRTHVKQDVTLTTKFPSQVWRVWYRRDLLFEKVKTDVRDQEQAVISGGRWEVHSYTARRDQSYYTCPPSTLWLLLSPLNALLSLLKIITQAINPERWVSC